MTAGQTRAVRELSRLRVIDPNGFQFSVEPEVKAGSLVVGISLKVGPIENKPGGLEFMDREDFLLSVPSDFPFERPSLWVTHTRFAGFPHINWGSHICLYQSDVEWNPADGLYGFFDRLRIWLTRAAINDMDPVEGPLHPPVPIPNSTLVPFVIRADCPVAAGASWFGLAELELHPNRVELTGWNDLSRDWPKERRPALAAILPEPLPVEFPTNGKEFFAELTKQKVDRLRILNYLRIAAKLTPNGEVAYLVLAIPMRRSPVGEPKHHIAVWSIAPEHVNYLKRASPKEGDPDDLRELRETLLDLVYKLFEEIPIAWCTVMEDRNEIVVARDKGSPLSWFSGKKVLVLGCGALGSWAAEMAARARPAHLDLVDNSRVKPGLLARQNYTLEDIGSNKAHALKGRLQEIVSGITIDSFARDAYRFLLDDLSQFAGYDIVLDCTASSNFQMKLERDWENFNRRTPPILSVVIDARAQHGLFTLIPSKSFAGVWNAYVQLKHRLCLVTKRPQIVSAFYSERAAKDLFQPEPGCSDLTFSGSTADVCNLISGALNLATPRLPILSTTIGGIVSSPTELRPKAEVIALAYLQEIKVGRYRVRVAPNAYIEARAWVRQNRRLRSHEHETGGLLWGLWDESVGVIWIFDASGPPPDSLHDPGHFVCGTEGTADEHEHRFKQSLGTTGFVGFWHTHPDMPSIQSKTDIEGMSKLVCRIGQNQKRSVMLIFGRTGGRPTAGIYVYESDLLTGEVERISVDMAQISLEEAVI